MSRQLIQITPGRFPLIPLDDWRADAECRKHDPRLWDAGPDKKEPDSVRDHRLAQAKRICHTACPVRKECADDVNPWLDEGVRGGHVLPPANFVGHRSVSARDVQLSKLLRAGVPLDEAVRRVQHKRDKAAS